MPDGLSSSSVQGSEYSLSYSLPGPTISVLFVPCLPPFAISANIAAISASHHPAILNADTSNSNSGTLTMERRRGTLPTGKGVAFVIPDYIAYEQHQSTDSSGSQDSVMTQVPLPYHLPNDHTYNQDFNYIPQIESTTDWNTPIIPSTSTFTFPPRQGSMAKSLNPSSSPYVPSGYTPSIAGPVPQSFQQPMQQFDNNGFMRSGVMAQPNQQQGQQIGMQQYQSGNSFRPQVNMQLGGPVGGTSPQFQSSFPATQGLYGHYGAMGGMNAGMNEFNPYNAGLAHMSPYGSNAVVLPDQGYGMMSFNSNYQSMPYGSAAAGGLNQPSYNPMHAGPNNSMQTSQPQQFTKPAANTNYGVRVPPYFPSSTGKQIMGVSAQGVHHSSNLATASALSYGGKSQQTGNTKLGGPVLAPPKIAKASSPTKSVASTRDSSRDRGSGFSEEDRGRTPGATPKTHALGLEFSSEPRNSETPRLRSRRGQSISDILTNPVRRNSTAGRFDNAPPLVNPTLQDNFEKRRRSPPKMLSLLAAGGVDTSILSPINENDPFSGTRPRPMSNLFAPITALSGPVGGLVGQPQRMSNQLRLLTDGGRCKPTIEEAFSPRNLPFIEIGRNLNPDEWGVIKIKNVRFPIRHFAAHANNFADPILGQPP